MYLFCTIRRESLFSSLSKVAASSDWDKIPVECHQGTSSVRLSRGEIGELLVVYMANTAEQTKAKDQSPGSWVSAVSRWGSWAKPLVKRVPPVFKRCSIRVSASEEKAAIELYNAALGKLAKDRKAASAEFLSASKHLRWVGEPAILLGFCALRDLRWGAAFEYARTGMQRLSEWGTSWDKRLTYAEWKGVSLAIMAHAEEAFAHPTQGERRVQQAISELSGDWTKLLRSFAESGIATPAPKPSLPPRFAGYLASFSKAGGAPKHNFYPGLAKHPVHPPKRFPLVKALEEAYGDIKAEFQRLRPEQEFHEESEKIRRKGRWDVFMFYELGKRNDANCALCPITTSVIEKHAAVHSISSAAYFSILGPRTHVAAHKGPTNMRLRCHLGIEVPDGCRLRVDREVLPWREGKCMVFDDSFTHEVWNDSARPRAVLVVDLWHPDLTADEILVLNELQRYAYAHAEEMSRYWLRNEKARPSLQAR